MKYVVFFFLRTKKNVYLIHKINSMCTQKLIHLNNCLFLLVMAAASIANIVKSSLGPVGLDKMLVDDIGVRFLFAMLTNSA